MNKNEEYRRFAVTLVQDTGKRLLTAFNNHELPETEFKPDRSYVTNLDVENDAVMCQAIQQHYPDHNLISEEAGDFHKQSAFTWHIDPLDGTSNFIFGVPLYGSMAALDNTDKVIAAAVCLPSLSLTFSATNDSRTLVNDHPIQELPINDLQHINLIIDSGKSKIGKLKTAHYLFDNECKYRSVRRFGCIASHVAMLNSHQPFVSMVLNADPHDLFPAALLFQQAGMVLMNDHGNTWTLQDRYFIACHPSLKAEIIPTLASMALEES